MRNKALDALEAQPRPRWGAQAEEALERLLREEPRDDVASASRRSPRGRPDYGSRPRQRSDVDERAASAASRPAAAKAALTSRRSSRVPICEPSRS